jgi:hypothetical protein
LRALVTDSSVVFEHVPDLTGAKTQHVAKHEYNSLARWKELEGGHEGERDGLTCLVARLGSGCGIRQAFKEEIRIRLEPDHLTHSGRFRWVVCVDRIVHLRATARGAKGVEASTRGDAVEPGAKRGAFLEVAEPPPGREQSLLERVFRVLARTEDAVAMHVKLAPIRVGELGERMPIPCPSLVQ